MTNDDASVRLDNSPGERRALRLILVGPASPYRGGIAQFNDALAERLRGRGHDVHVVTFSRQYPGFLFPGTSQLDPGAVRRGPEPLALIDSINPASWLATARRIRALAPDAVIFQYWLPFFAPAYGTIAGRLRRGAGKRVAVLHNVLPHERRPGDRVLGRFFLRRCEGAVALSDSVARDLRSLGVDTDVRVSPHPVYEHFGVPPNRVEARRRLALSDDADVLLFFGFVRRYKGLHILLEAMPEIVRRRPRARLVVAGEFYEDEEKCRSLIGGLGLDEVVQMHSEYIDDDRVGDFFSAADVVVQPYLSATQSGVVQTAYHFGKPVIVTNVGGLAEVVPHERAGLVVPPESPEAVASAVVRFFQESLANRLAEGVREEKERYSWDHFLDVIEEITA